MQPTQGHRHRLLTRLKAAAELERELDAFVAKREPAPVELMEKMLGVPAAVIERADDQRRTGESSFSIRRQLGLTRYQYAMVEKYRGNVAARAATPAIPHSLAALDPRPAVPDPRSSWGADRWRKLPLTAPADSTPLPALRITGGQWRAEKSQQARNAP